MSSTGENAMLTNDWDTEICADHNEDDCAHCPLLIDLSRAMCKWNSHYDRKKGEWVKDDKRGTEQDTGRSQALD